MTVQYLELSNDIELWYDPDGDVLEIRLESYDGPLLAIYHSVIPAGKLQQWLNENREE